jgi:hypothetical protein
MTELKRRWYMVMLVGMMVLGMAMAATAQSVPMGTVNGTWELSFDNGARGKLVVDKNKGILDVPKFFQGEGGTGDRGDYVEFFMNGKSGGRLFVFANIKGGMLEGALQDRVPCESMKKTFGPAVKVTNTSCQVPFKATKK